jgi:hypothetical protein
MPQMLNISGRKNCLTKFVRSWSKSPSFRCPYFSGHVGEFTADGSVQELLRQMTVAQAGSAFEGSEDDLGGAYCREPAHSLGDSRNGTPQARFC